MIIKGIVSEIQSTSDIRLVIPTMDSKVSYRLELADHIDINNLNIGDRVIVAFYTNIEGVIIAKCQP